MEEEVKDVMERKYLNLKPDNYSAGFEKYKYAFELDIPRGKEKYYTIRYPYEYKTIRSDVTGKYFKFILGTTYTALETFILELKIKGP